MDAFSSQLGMIKCSEVRHFSMKFPSEGEIWYCHFAGNKNLKPDNSGKVGVRKQENLKSATFCATYCTIGREPLPIINYIRIKKLHKWSAAAV